MKVPGSIRLAAGQLQEALAVAVPKQRKNSRRKQTWPITLGLDNDRSILEISEAKHALKGYEVTATGTWPEKVQVDGQLLRQIVEKYSREDVIELVATDEEFCLLKSGSIVRMKRLDGGGKPGIKRRPIPQDPKHTGPVICLQTLLSLMKLLVLIPARQAEKVTFRLHIHKHFFTSLAASATVSTVRSNPLSRSCT